MEQAALVTVVISGCYPLEGRDAFWFIDNSVTLSAMIKGSSSEPDIARTAAALHLTLAAKSCSMWFEYIESESNWADEPCRKLWASEFLGPNGFHPRRGIVPAWPWIEEDGRVQRDFPLHSPALGGAASLSVGTAAPSRFREHEAPMLHRAP